MNTETQTPVQTPAADTPIQGRSVFIVETTAQGIAVQTAFATEDGRVLQLPAMFPNLDYAYAQIDELRRLVGQHFAQAAQIGAQVIANQLAQQQAATTTVSATDAPAATQVATEPATTA